MDNLRHQLVSFHVHDAYFILSILLTIGTNVNIFISGAHHCDVVLVLEVYYVCVVFFIVFYNDFVVLCQDLTLVSEGL